MRNGLVKDLLVEIGLWRWPPFYRDHLFWMAVLAGAAVSAAMGDLLAPTKPDINLWFLFSLIVWQPLLEEVLFRGIIQGQLVQRGWGARAFWGISNANLLTSIAFCGVHFIYHPPLWAALVFIPSLVFGLFRDRHSSVYPCWILHGAYNAFYTFLVI